MATTAAALLSMLALASAIEPPRNPWQPVGNGERLLTFNETTPSPRWGPSSVSVRWAGADGQYITTNSAGDLVLIDIATGDTETFLSAAQLPSGRRDFWIGPEEATVLVAANATGVYRHSYLADYYIIDVESGESVPLVEDQAGDIQYATLAPVGDLAAFVRGNNLFIREGDGTIHQITTDGGPDMFHGVPDWVYEEEIFSDRYTLWFSPDAQFLAFLSFNETGVGTFTIPYYMDGQTIAPQYPNELDLRYPKVGTTNPTVQLNMLDLDALTYDNIPVDAFAADDLVIGEVAWVTEDHSSFIYRAFNRVQDLDKHVLVNPVTGSSTVVRERDGTDGWLDNTVAIQYVGHINNCTNQTYYVDLSDEDGWTHLYLHSVNGGTPTQLTSGEWEVIAILYVDAERHLVYYTATTHHSTERHVYSVSFRGDVTPLVDDEVSAVWTASFSSQGGYFILSYRGPDVPYQELYAVNSSEPLRVISNNDALYQRIEEYNLPNITHFELEHEDGYSLNVKAMYPPNFDPSKKYPVLFTPYGGPGYQLITKAWTNYEWEAYLTSDPELQYITYTVDNRGTGNKGRAFRAQVAGRLGTLEPLDQVWAAETLIARHDYIDANKVGIFGWSYGGYLSAKVVELDSGVFTKALIVAPVTDWRFYDSMYTERYMKRLEDNEDGYATTAVRNTAGFKNIAGDFSVLHGTGDDNVHYQNAAAMVDLLVGEGVSSDKFKMFAFTDSAHGISYNNAGLWIHKFMTERLYDEVQRDPDAEAEVHPWSKRSSRM
ncbi:dipeptidyl peptidase IV N-terminal region-domain-containing protein [Stachybotrys elegans]|uniref:Probable dipeptidyl-aminopeptidase B n=1 Tax=Stachybotrys elegans TaxID=80388 RepID=A0A8K0SIP9_9HYPO|nr:dipeptidyl peptidase IV N-terminal region-domain-containing protein [Stachybotrys elegans]